MRDRAEIFEKNRARLTGVAYRMLGSRADAEDIVQDAFLRWHRAATDEIRSPEAWLVTTFQKALMLLRRRVVLAVVALLASTSAFAQWLRNRCNFRASASCIAINSGSAAQAARRAAPMARAPAP